REELQAGDDRGGAEDLLEEQRVDEDGADDATGDDGHDGRGRAQGPDLPGGRRDQGRRYSPLDQVERAEQERCGGGSDDGLDRGPAVGADVLDGVHEGEQPGDECGGAGDVEGAGVAGAAAAGDGAQGQDGGDDADGHVDE